MTKNRHELPRKKPGRSAKDEIAEDLPTLEPVDDLPTLEPVADADVPTLEPLDDDVPTLEPVAEVVDDGPVQVAVAAGDGAAFDTVVTVTVPAMDKQAVVAALHAPLARVLGANAKQLRHRRVQVLFVGEAVIGTAAKDATAKALAVHVPLRGVVSRGYGDEEVLQGKVPEVQVKATDANGALRLDVATGELDPIDLAMIFAPHWTKALAGVRGKKVQLVFAGKGKPDSALRAEWVAAAKAAGATRFAIGERVFFDLELASRVRVTSSGDAVTIAVDPAADDATTSEALGLVLPEHAGVCKGKAVRVQLARAADGPLAELVAFAREQGPTGIEVAVANAAPAVVWPPLLSLAKGAELVLRVQPNGRSRDAVLAALVKEAGEHAAATKGKAVVVDLPAGFAVDAAALTALRSASVVGGAKSAAFTIGGDLREPFLPEPVSCTASAEGFVLRLDGESGKAADLQRALDRALPPLLAGWRGRSVRVQVAGTAVVSRTLLRSLCSAIEAAGAMRLELEEAGDVDVLLPGMLTVSKKDGAVHLAAVVGGRDEAQQQKALARELDAAQVGAGAIVTVGPSSIAEAIGKVLVARGAARVVLDGPEPLQVHPPLFGAPEKKSLAIKLVVQPSGDAAMVARQLAHELPGVLAGLGALSSTTVTVQWPGVDPSSPALASLLAGLVDKKAKKVMLERGGDKPQQLHPVVAPPPAPVGPPPLPAATPAAATAPAAAAAQALATSTGGSHLTLLGRRDDSVPPMILLGVTAGTDAAQLAAVEAELQANLARFRGRSVLIVPRQNGQDVPVRKPDAFVELVRRVVPNGAAATLLFRGPDAQGRPHFQVLHSSLRALPVGSVFADPRVRR